MIKQTKTERLAEHVAEFRAKMKLDSWNAFIKEVGVPNDLYPAIQTGRKQLMPKGRALTADECQAVYNVLAAFIETNSALREHTEKTAQLVDEWSNAFKGLATLAHTCNSLPICNQQRKTTNSYKMNDWNPQEMPRHLIIDSPSYAGRDK